jgi:integrase
MARRRGNNQGTIRKRGDGRWEGRVTLPNGQSKSFYGKRQQEVSQKITQAIRDLEAGNLLTDEKQTVGQFLQFWIETHAMSVSGSSMRPYDLYIRDYLIPRFGVIPLVKLTPQKVQMGLAEMLADGISAYSVRYSHRVLKQALNTAIDLGMISRNPALKMQLPRVVKRKYVTWSENQVRAFLSQVEGHRYEMAFWLMVSTAMRVGEVAALRWEDVDWESSVIHVRSSLTVTRHHERILGGTKTTSSQRDIILVPQVAEKLFQYYHQKQEASEFLPSDLMFLNMKGGIVSTQSIWQAFTRASRKAGLPQIRPHDVRHTTATLLIKRKVNIKVVSQMLGHANTAITMNIYAHVLDEMEREASDMMGKILDGGDS